MSVSTLSAARDTAFQEGRVQRYLMAASRAIHKGALVGLASGLAQPFADASGQLFVGIADESVTSAASGSFFVRVRKYGVHKLSWYDDDAVANADIGAELFGASDAQVSPNASGSGATKKVAQNIKVGTLVGFESTVPLVRIDNYVR